MTSRGGVVRSAMDDQYIGLAAHFRERLPTLEKDRGLAIGVAGMIKAVDVQSRVADSPSKNWRSNRTQ